MNKGLMDFLKKHYDYAGGFEVKEYKQEGNYHEVTLKFDEDEELNVLIKQRKGDNGNYRIVCAE